MFENQLSSNEKRYCADFCFVSRTKKDAVDHIFWRRFIGNCFLNQYVIMIFLIDKKQFYHIFFKRLSRESRYVQITNMPSF